MSHPDGSPDFTLLADWLEGRLEAERAAQVADDVASGTPRVQASAEWLRGFLSAASVLPLQQPPPIVRQRLRQHYARWSASRAVLYASTPRYDAVLVFDSRLDLATAGVRGGDEDDAVHLAFVSEVGDIVLDATPRSDGHVTIDGQILVAEDVDAPVFEVTARWGATVVRSIDGDRLGRFRLPSVPRERAQLTLSNGEATVHLSVDFGRPA